MKYKMRFLAAGILMLGMAAFAWSFGLGSDKPKDEKATLGYGTDGGVDSTLKDVPTQRPEVVTQDARLRLTGSLVADETSKVASTTNGIVNEVRVERGSVVEKGDVLVVVDPRDADNMLADGRAQVQALRAALGWENTSKPFSIEEQPGVKAAKAAMDLAKANYDRHNDLIKQGAVSKLSHDQMETSYKTACEQYQQSLHQAKQLYQTYNAALVRLKPLEKAVADTTIIAPFSGMVAEKFVSPGERVTTSPIGGGATILSLVKLDPLRLIVTVPQQYAPLIQQGQKVDFTVEAFPGKTFTAEVKFVGPSLESGTRSLTVEAIVANNDRALRPGYFASAELLLPEKEQRMVIPATSLTKTGEAVKAAVLRDGKIVEKVVIVDREENGRVFVKSGLNAEDDVVSDSRVLAETGKVSQ
jgi:RND family efflux transporter MFP subunit